MDKHGKLFVTDFGLARIEAVAGVTMTGDLMGTLRYMSPEQVTAGRVLVDQRSDIYSLGATLYELLSLQPIWEGHDRADLIRKISFDEPVRLRTINPAIPNDLETVVLKSLAKNPSERYESTAALAEDLQRFLDRKPVLAKRPTTLQRINSWSRRNPAIVWSAILLMAVITIASIVSNGLLLKEKRRVTAAKEQAERRLVQLVKGNEIISSIFEDLDIVAIRENDQSLESILAERLVDAGKHLIGEAIGDPLVVAGMQDRLGQSLESLGYAEEAIELLRQALTTRAALLESGHPDRLDSASNLATALLSNDQPELAVPLFEQTLEFQQAKLGVNDPHTLESMSNLGVAYHAAGQLENAAPSWNEHLRSQPLSRGSSIQTRWPL